MKVFGGLTRTAIQAVLLASVGFGSIAIAAPGDTTRVSVSSSGQQGDKASHFPSISADGRFVAFTSGASNLVHGDTNSLDVFVHDRQTGVTTRVNVNSRGGQGNWYSGNVSISGDGRIVAFDGGDSNLVDGDTNNANDVFVHDRHTGMTTRVSVNSRGTQGDDSSDFPSISADGRFVAFRSLASNLVDDDTNGTWDVFVHDRQTGNTTRVSVHSSGAQGGNQNNVHVSVPSISADGRFVAFSSFDELVDGVTTSFPSIFVHDRQTAATTMVSMDSRGAQLGGQQPSISADGRFVAFKSNGIFVHDRENGMTTRVDATPPGKLISSPSISADGRFVAFDADASNLADGATKYLTDVFVHDRQIGNTTRVSVNSRGTQGNNRSNSPSISADGRFVAFHSDASNLVDGDTNGMSDVFVHEMAIAKNTAQRLTSPANLQRQFPETYAAIWEIPSVSNVTKETAITALETMITLAYSPEMNDLMWSRLGVNAADLVGWATKNPQRAVALSGKEIGWNLAVSAAISVSAALVADSLFATQPMASVPQSWQNPLKALVRATIIEVAGLAHAASNPAAIVGPLVNRLIDVVEIYKASRALTKVIDQALVATALGLETAAQLAVDFPNARSQRVAEDTVADLLGRVREFVGEDDEAAVQQIGALTYAALISQRRGDLQTARGLVVQIQREGKLSSNIHPFSAITNPVEWLTAVARAVRDTPEQAANIMITATALRDLLADSLAIEECRKQLVTVSIDESKCGYSLTKDGVVKFQEKHLFRFDQVSADIHYVHNKSGEKITFGTNTRIMLFPQSPSGRFHIIDACHYECGNIRLLDSHIGTIHRFSAGKYGPYPDISWGPDERLAALFSSNEGFSQIHIVNTQTGQYWAFPDWGSATDDASQLILGTQQLVWVDPTTFYVDARFCTALKPSTRCYDLERLSIMPIERVLFRVGTDGVIPAVTATEAQSKLDIQTADLPTNRLSLGRVAQGSYALMDVLETELKSMPLTGLVAADACYFAGLSAAAGAAASDFVLLGVNEIAVGITQVALNNVTTGTKFGDTLLRMGVDLASAVAKQENASRALGKRIAQETLGYVLPELTRRHFEDDSGHLASVLTPLSAAFIEELLVDEGISTRRLTSTNEANQAFRARLLPRSQIDLTWIFSPKTHYLTAYISSKCNNSIEGFYVVRFKMIPGLGGLNRRADKDTVIIKRFRN